MNGADGGAGGGMRGVGGLEAGGSGLGDGVGG
jgi:hypothetical protein